MLREHKKAIREAALKRQAKYDSLTTDQKIAKVKSRCGNSKKEISKLEAKRGK